MVLFGLVLIDLLMFGCCVFVCLWFLVGFLGVLLQDVLWVWFAYVVSLLFWVGFLVVWCWLLRVVWVWRCANCLV